MPVIGRLGPVSAAQVFADYLAHEGIGVRLVPDGKACLIEIADPADAQRAQDELAAFLANPKAAKYRAASWHTGRTAPAGAGGGFSLGPLLDRAGPLTKILALGAVLVTLYTEFGRTDRALAFMFSTRLDGIPDILAGEIYRLVTPIFLHYWIPGLGPLHLLFNLMWFWDLGGAIERRLGTGLLAVLVVVIAVLSNSAQFLVSGPLFGGLSGVVYGLLGFVWLRGRYDPASGLAAPKAVVSFMLLWLVLCYTGLMGPVANAAHTVGLAAGCVLGLATALWSRR